MRDWCSQQADWRGTAAELAEVVRDLLEKLDLVDAQVIPNERLVRNYVQQGILQKPVRVGKEAYFGVRQVIEYLVARKLLAEGWPLAKIAEFNQTNGLDELLDLLPRRRERNEAEKLVARFRRSAVAEPTNQAPQAMPAIVPSPSPFLSHSAERAKRKSTARDHLRSLGNPTGEATRHGLVKLTLTPWCELLIDPEGLQGLSPEVLDDMGETIAQVLREELLIQKRRSP